MVIKWPIRHWPWQACGIVDRSADRLACCEHSQRLLTTRGAVAPLAWVAGKSDLIALNHCPACSRMPDFPVSLSPSKFASGAKESGYESMSSLQHYNLVGQLDVIFGLEKLFDEIFVCELKGY